MSDAPRPNAPAPDASTVARLRLRETPRPVLRLSRKMLIGLGGICGVGLAAALAVAVTPAKPKPAAAPLGETSGRAHPATEALAELPKDYTDVPRLGPPLPGDLGRPILAAQDGGPPPAYATPPLSGPPPERSSSQAAAVQARSAAHNSQIFFAQPAEATSAPMTPQLASPAVDPLAGLSAWPLPSQTGTTEPDKKRAFLEQIPDLQPVSDQRLTRPASPYMLMAGSVVPAALITGIRSDIPGQVLAQVTQDIRDSVTGRYLLIPRGSRLIGQYDNTISVGQTRLLLVWSRLILPNGRSIILERLSAADGSGYAGLQDHTDNHWSSIAGAAALSTILAVGAAAGEPDSEGALVRAIRSGGADATDRAGRQIVERQLNIQPNLTIRPGLPVRVILSRDLVLEPYGGT